VAFGIPGVLMFIATLMFWLGRRQYVHVPPPAADPDSFLNVVRTALLARGAGQGRPGLLVAGFGAALAVAAVCWALHAWFVGFVSAIS
jgi:POT family proton-dependent oligopeptide transporter